MFLANKMALGRWSN